MKRMIVVALSFLLALMVAAPLAFATQGDQGTAVQSTVGELGAAWWQWAGSPRTANNPTVDSYSYTTKVGAIKCDGSNPTGAWFLAGTSSGPSTVTRDCTAPANTPIFFPVVTFVCGPAWSDPFNTESELRDECNSIIDTVLTKATPFATVDGKKVRMVRADTPVFESKVPKDNPFGVVGGKSIAVADGLWVLLPEGLSPGQHTIEFGGTFTNPFYNPDDPNSSPTFTIDATYNLTVQ